MQAETGLLHSVFLRGKRPTIICVAIIRDRQDEIGDGSVLHAGHEVA